MNVIAFDLGTTTGWAMSRHDHTPLSGTLDLRAGRFSGGGMRFVRFRNELEQLLTGVELVAFEEVRFHASVDSAHVYGGLLAILTAECEARSLPYEGVPPGTIKKHWTGKGNAKKPAMIAEAQRRGFRPKDDNEADALALLDYAHLAIAPKAKLSPAGMNG